MQGAPETNAQIRDKFKKVFHKLENGQVPGKAPGTNKPAVITNLLPNSSMHPTFPIDPRAIPPAKRFPPYPNWNNVIRSYNAYHGTKKNRSPSRSRSRSRNRNKSGARGKTRRN